MNRQTWRNILSTLGPPAAFLAAMAGLFVALALYLDARIDSLDRTIQGLQEVINARFDAQDRLMDARFDAQDRLMDARFEEQNRLMDARFADQAKIIDARINGLEKVINERRAGTLDPALE